MPGLKESGAIAHKRLTQHLNAHGYYQSRHTPSLRKHESLPIIFILLVDGFGVKYVGNHAPVHLYATLEKQYDISVDRSGSKWLGLALDWDYAQGHVTLSMLNYVGRDLRRFYLNPLAKFDLPAYKSKVQYSTQESSETAISAHAIQFAQRAVGVFFIMLEH